MRPALPLLILAGFLATLLTVPALAQPAAFSGVTLLKDSDIPLSPMPVTRPQLYEATESQGLGYLEGNNLAHGALNDGQTFTVLDHLEGVVLPHCAWAQPWAGGPIKVLTLGYTTAAPEIVDFEQRLDGKVYVGLLPLSTAGGFGSAWLSKAQAANFLGYATKLYLKRLRDAKPDVLALNAELALPFQDPELRAELEKQVRAGMGLVLLMGRDTKGAPLPDLLPVEAGPVKQGALPWAPEGQPHAAWSGVAYRSLPQLNGLAQVTVPGDWQVRATVAGLPYLLTTELGQGRVAVLTARPGGYNSFFPEVTGWSREDWITPAQEYRWTDDMASAYLKLCQWAARKDTGLVFTVDTPAAAEPAAPVPATVKVAAAPAGLICSLVVEVQNERRETVHSAKQQAALQPGQEIALTIPALRCRGRYYVDVVARDAAGKSLGWASNVTDVTAGPEAEISVDADVLKPGQAVAGRLAAKSLAATDLPATATVELWDSWGRLIARAEKPLNPPPAPGGGQGGGALAADGAGPAFRFDLRYCPAHVLCLVGRVESGKQTVAYTEKEITVPEFGPAEDWRVGMWMAQYRRLRLHEEILRRCGLTGAVISPFGPPLLVAKNAVWTNMDLHAENAFYAAVGVGTVGGGNTAQDPGNWPGEQKYEKAFTTYTDGLGALLRRYGCRVMSLANESWPAKTLLFDMMKRDFQGYLQEEYHGDLARLNAEWGTNFAAWDQVDPPAPAPGTTNFAPQMEVQQFLHQISAREQRRAVEKYFGLMGASVPWGTTSSGFSIYQAEQGAGLYGGSAAYPLDLGHDLWNDATFPFTKVGFEEPEKNYSLYPWKALFNGSSTEWQYLSGGSAAIYGAFNQRGLWVKQHEQEIRDGIGKLLITSKLERDPVALLYEENSEFTDYTEWGLASLVAGDDSMDQQTYVRLAESSRRSLDAALKDAQIRPRWVSEKMVQAGALQGVKLLFLSANFCLSAETARAIDQWVQAGGTVVADLLPGAYDEHGKWRGQGPLDPVFGFQRKDLKVVHYPAEYTAGLLEGIPGFLETFGTEWFFVAIHEGNIAATAGQALGRHFTKDQAPAFVFHRHGKGAALYLNYLDTDYIRSRDPRDLRFIRALLQQVGVTPPVWVVEQVGGQPLSGLEITRFRDDRATHLCVLGGQGEAAEVQPGAGGYLYDTRKHECLGQGKQFSVTFSADFPRVLSLLPCRVDGVKLTCPAAMRGQVVSYQITPALTGPPTSLVYRLDFTDPVGNPREAYRVKVRAPAGKYTGVWQPALNDPVGNWKITVTEIVSGKSATVTVGVK
jgi:hypothetical protein